VFKEFTDSVRIVFMSRMPVSYTFCHYVFYSKYHVTISTYWRVLMINKIRVSWTTMSDAYLLCM